MGAIQVPRDEFESLLAKHLGKQDGQPNDGSHERPNQWQASYL